MQKTVTIDQANIDQLRKSYSERLMSALADYGDMPADRESLLLGKFAKVFTHLSNPNKEFGGNRLFKLDLDEAVGKDAAYMVKSSLPGLLATTQVVMNTWEKEYFKHPVLPIAANAAASKPADSSKSGSKYGPGDKSAKYKSVRFSDKDNKEYRNNRWRGGSILPPYSLLHITCRCDDIDVSSMLHLHDQQLLVIPRNHSIRHRC